MSYSDPNSRYIEQPQQPAETSHSHPGVTQVGKPVGYPPGPNAPYGYDPFGRPYSDKSKIVAGVLSVFLGPLGIGRFYTGHTGLAVAQLVTLGGLGVWTLIDGLILLLSNDKTDAAGRILRS
ncbi:TM2 domain-containing protein [Streptomyces caniscabiei]|uniref:TM2 domain-containing protein n=1 Tax=Streptomyces caniscabiei TaxID=2746961 RepID=UPI0029B3DC87|nr:TM2 domain-containing protein [Streptomyces caniscabiei]MDX2599670.1 TM2 domain-containing protein [Streptomyces caniscabiei]MDX2735035.1 TM2 domain-containing protein [Streptomyces caniscabiei]MDX2776731.1 TM2 domain-containing protein [Streptomyces caniscabiei]